MYLLLGRWGVIKYLYQLAPVLSLLLFKKAKKTKSKTLCCKGNVNIYTGADITWYHVYEWRSAKSFRPVSLMLRHTFICIYLYVPLSYCSAQQVRRKVSALYAVSVLDGLPRYEVGFSGVHFKGVFIDNRCFPHIPAIGTFFVQTLQNSPTPFDWRWMNENKNEKTVWWKKSKSKHLCVKMSRGFIIPDVSSYVHMMMWRNIKI